MERIPGSVVGCGGGDGECVVDGVDTLDSGDGERYLSGGSLNSASPDVRSGYNEPDFDDDEDANAGVSLAGGPG